MYYGFCNHSEWGMILTISQYIIWNRQCDSPVVATPSDKENFSWLAFFNASHSVESCTLFCHEHGTQVEHEWSKWSLCLGLGLRGRILSRRSSDWNKELLYSYWLVEEEGWFQGPDESHGLWLLLAWLAPEGKGQRGDPSWHPQALAGAFACKPCLWQKIGFASTEALHYIFAAKTYFTGCIQ
jgi:hypothetical protein